MVMRVVKISVSVGVSWLCFLEDWCWIRWCSVLKSVVVRSSVVSVVEECEVLRGVVVVRRSEVMRLRNVGEC